MAILAAVGYAEFTYLRDRVGATDGNLAGSTHRPAMRGRVRIYGRKPKVSPSCRHSFQGKTLAEQAG